MTTASDNAMDRLELAAETEIITGEKVVNEFARVTQYLTWPFLWLVFHLFYKLRIGGREHFREVEDPFVIVANHVDFYHSFAFRLILGPLTTHLPLRFMAVTRFDWRSLNFLSSIGVIAFVYSLFGVFTVTPGLGMERNLRKAREIIEAGGNIVIYPEGKVNVSGGVGPFKNGAAALVRQTGVKVVPVSFRLGAHRLWRRALEVNVGAPIAVDKSLSVEKITEVFREKVKGLYGRQ